MADHKIVIGEDVVLCQKLTKLAYSVDSNGEQYDNAEVSYHRYHNKHIIESGS